MNIVRDALIGLAVGDALGVPVEFESRENLVANPVTDMRAYGTYSQPAGTWSDDSSLTFCLADSLTQDFNLADMAQKFVDWSQSRIWTPHGRVVEHSISFSPAPTISSSGYVMHSLEAAMWCVLRHNTYEETVLAAVNLGHDTDTTAAIAGGLAGILYGFDAIPTEWVNQLTRRNDIFQLCDDLNKRWN